MNITIHHGTHEIGGSCVEISSGENRIVIDIGMPLVEESGERFDSKICKTLSPSELVKEKILPDIKGIYKSNKGDKPIDWLFISHSHIDHYGIYTFLRDDIYYYVGEKAKKLIDLTTLFLNFNGDINKCTYLESGKEIKVGNFTITLYLMDHTAFDAYGFLIECEGKKIFYSGDFREHERKGKAFDYFLSKVPENIDALLLEGSLVGSERSITKSEEDIENDIVKTINNTDKIVFGVSSSQNIDRLVSFFKAARRTKRLFVSDVYTSNVLAEIGGKTIPHTSKGYGNIRVYFFPQYTCNKLVKKKREKMIYKFYPYKISMAEISENPGNIVMMVRMSMVRELSLIKGIEGASVIYSMWNGYLEENSSKRFIDFMEEKNMQLIKHHTSGHATIATLEKFVKKTKPKMIIPIHTFSLDKYAGIFPSEKVISVNDRELITS
ncbi:MAG: MBL fold metallo-hydrolase [Candidatus Schekmanbacteria bacterium]|nr:MAG: MBL fold metallo-hydrolase [Candidatus Schekmanbacteria bacterium]